MNPMENPPVSPAKHIVAVGSGKGGVGKSTVCLNLALALSQDGARVGILDADVYGPNIPLMVNLTRKKPTKSFYLAFNLSDKKARKIEPIERYGLKVMSSGFIVSEDQPIVWDAGMVSALITRLLFHVEWGELDYLMVDLPPGTADLQQMFARQMPLSGAIIVVGPQDVAHLDGRKAVQMYRQNGVRIIGAIENMSGLYCPHCNERIDVFHPVEEARAIWTLGIEKLEDIPLDPRMSRAGDTGHPLMVVYPESSQADSFRAASRRLVEILQSPEAVEL